MFLGKKSVQPMFLESISQLYSLYGSITLSGSYDWTAVPEPFTVSRSVFFFKAL